MQISNRQAISSNHDGQVRSHISMHACMKLFALIFLFSICLGYLNTIHQARLRQQSSWLSSLWLSPYDDTVSGFVPSITLLTSNVAASLGACMWEYLPLEILLPTIAGFYGLPRLSHWLHAMLTGMRFHRNSYHHSHFQPHMDYMRRPPGTWITNPAWHHPHPFHGFAGHPSPQQPYRHFGWEYASPP